MESRPFTEKALKVLKNSSKPTQFADRAKRAESKLTEYYHRQSIPILVDESLLRARGLGQIDLSFYNGKVIEVIEIKSSSIGSSQFYRSKQYGRVKKSAEFLSKIFDRNALVKCEALIDNFDI